MSNKAPNTNHDHLPHHFCFNLCIFSFGFCLVFETSLWVFALLLLLVFLQILGLVTSLRGALEMRWVLIFVCKLGSLKWWCLDFLAKFHFLELSPLQWCGGSGVFFFCLAPKVIPLAFVVACVVGWGWSCGGLV